MSTLRSSLCGERRRRKRFDPADARSRSTHTQLPIDSPSSSSISTARERQQLLTRINMRQQTSHSRTFQAGFLGDVKTGTQRGKWMPPLIPRKRDSTKANKNRRLPQPFPGEKRKRPKDPRATLRPNLTLHSLELFACPAEIRLRRNSSAIFLACFSPE